MTSNIESPEKSGLLPDRKETNMRFGCCGSLVAAGPDRTGVEIVEKMAGYGYDYIELPLAEMMELRGEEFAALCRRVEESGIRCEVCNNFFPGNLRLTGPDADPGRIREYYTRALDRAARLGVKVIVFGSAGAKRVPDGFGRPAAWQQVVDVTRASGEAAAAHGITIAIEPVRHPDCNIINTFAEGVQLARTVELENVRFLVDFYHMVCEQESPDVLRRYGAEYLRHVHFSYPAIPEIDGVRDPARINTIYEGELNRRGWWRTYPSCREEWDYSGFVQALKDCGYDGRISLEAPVRDFDRQAPQALAFLKTLFG